MSGLDQRAPPPGSPVAFKILDYLEAHPDAKDTAEGIAEWWVEEDPLEVRCALQELVALGELGKSSASTEFYFRIPRELVYQREVSLGSARDERQGLQP